MPPAANPHRRYRRERLAAAQAVFRLGPEVEDEGSLTIVATALARHRQTDDDVVFEEFKGTGYLGNWCLSAVTAASIRPST